MEGGFCFCCYSELRNSHIILIMIFLTSWKSLKGSVNFRVNFGDASISCELYSGHRIFVHSSGGVFQGIGGCTNILNVVFLNVFVMSF